MGKSRHAKERRNWEAAALTGITKSVHVSRKQERQDLHKALAQLVSSAQNHEAGGQATTFRPAGGSDFFESRTDIAPIHFSWDRNGFSMPVLETPKEKPQSNIEILLYALAIDSRLKLESRIQYLLVHVFKTMYEKRPFYDVDDESMTSKA